MLPGVRPSMLFADSPTAAMFFVPPGPRSWRMATTDGSLSHQDLPWLGVAITNGSIRRV
jgi:hypothetical protein